MAQESECHTFTHTKTTKNSNLSFVLSYDIENFRGYHMIRAKDKWTILELLNYLRAISKTRLIENFPLKNNSWSKQLEKFLSDRFIHFEWGNLQIQYLVTKRYTVILSIIRICYSLVDLWCPHSFLCFRRDLDLCWWRSRCLSIGRICRGFGAEKVLMS
jgi:hypothetical protein